MVTKSDTILNSEKTFLDNEINEINRNINECSENTKSEYLYLKMIREHDLKLLNGIAEYPRLAYEYALLEQDEIGYRKYLKELILNKRIELAYQITNCSRSLNKYLSEVDNYSDYKKEEVLSLIATYKKLLKKLNAEKMSLDNDAIMLSSKTKEDLIKELSSKVFNSCIKKLNIPDYSTISRRDKAVYAMALNKNHNDFLNKNTRRIKRLTQKANNLEVPFNYDFGINPCLLIGLEDKYGVTNSGVNVSLNTLDDIELFLTQKKVSVNKKSIYVSNAGMLLDLANSKMDSIEFCLKHYDDIKYLVNIPGYLASFSAEYEKLKSKLFKSSDVQNRLLNLESVLNKETEKVVANLRLLVVQNANELAQEIGADANLYSFSVMEVYKKNLLFKNALSEYMKDLYGLYGSVNKSYGELGYQKKGFEFEIKDLVREISQKSQIPLTGDEDFNLSGTDIIRIYDKVYLSKKMKDIDDRIMTSLISEEVEISKGMTY